MYVHGPSCLKGPVNRARQWWSGSKEGPLPQTSSVESTSLPDTQPFRADLVERVRRQIAAGTYDTPEKFEIALDRLMRRLDEE